MSRVNRILQMKNICTHSKGKGSWSQLLCLRRLCLDLSIYSLQPTKAGPIMVVVFEHATLNTSLVAFGDIHCVRFIAYYVHKSAFGPLPHFTLSLPWCQLSLFLLHATLLSLFVYTFSFSPS